ncbi:unnamed protein product [Phaeothamnion confervicola]
MEQVFGSPTLLTAITAYIRAKKPEWEKGRADNIARQLTEQMTRSTAPAALDATSLKAAIEYHARSLGTQKQQARLLGTLSVEANRRRSHETAAPPAESGKRDAAAGVANADSLYLDPLHLMPVLGECDHAGGLAAFPKLDFFGASDDGDDECGGGDSGDGGDGGDDGGGSVCEGRNNAAVLLAELPSPVRLSREDIPPQGGDGSDATAAPDANNDGEKGAAAIGPVMCDEADADGKRVRDFVPEKYGSGSGAATQPSPREGEGGSEDLCEDSGDVGNGSAGGAGGAGGGRRCDCNATANTGRRNAGCGDSGDVGCGGSTDGGCGGGNSPGSGGPGDAADVAEARRHAIRLLQSRLLLLTHAGQCAAAEGACPAYERCHNVRGLLAHLRKCSEGDDCREAHCLSSRRILNHHAACREPACNVCSGAREAARQCEWRQREAEHRRRLMELYEERRRNRGPKRARAEVPSFFLDASGNALAQIAPGFFVRQHGAARNSGGGGSGGGAGDFEVNSDGSGSTTSDGGGTSSDGGGAFSDGGGAAASFDGGSCGGSAYSGGGCSARTRSATRASRRNAGSDSAWQDLCIVPSKKEVVDADAVDNASTTVAAAPLGRWSEGQGVGD